MNLYRPSRARIEFSWKDLLGQPLPHDHVVQPYRDERVLVDAVTFYAGTALGRGESVILVATHDHLAAIEEHLAQRRFELADLKQWGVLTTRNAAELLYGFMVDGLPDPVLFRALMGQMVQKAAARSRRRNVRVYGEMVNLLWRINLRAAHRLEALWNDLLAAHDMSLFCAYQIDADGGPRPELPGALRDAHSHLIPVEATA